MRKEIGPVLIMDGKGVYPENLDKVIEEQRQYLEGPPLTIAQCRAIYSKWQQSDQGKTFDQFLGTVKATYGCDGAVSVAWCGMFLCIERNGYTHS